MSLQEPDAKVVRDVEVIQLAVVDDTGDRGITEIVADIFPGCFTRRGIIGHIEDMARRCWRVSVVA